MPEYDSLHVARRTLYEKGEGLRAVGRVERQAVLGREPTRRLAFRRRVPVALPQPVYHRQRETGNGKRDTDGMPREQAYGPTRQRHRSPAVGDEPWRYADGDDPRGPAERGHCQGHAGGGATRAQGEDDRLRGLGRLRGELQSGEQMSRHRSRVGATAGNPAPRSQRPGAPPGAQHGEGKGRRAGRADDQRRPAGTRRGDRATRDGLGLAELCQHGLVSQGRGVDRGAETVRGARATRRDEDRSGRDAGQQELEPAYLGAAARRRRPVFALEAEGGHAQRAGEGRRRLERRGPFAQATRLERRAYLFAQQRRIRHVNPDPEDADAGCHGLHPPRRARRPQVRGRPARWPAPFPTAGRRLLQDAGQGAGGDRRGPGRAQQARVSYIHTPAALADAVATLRREPLVAADTEAASFHRHHDRIFLVQLASPSLTAIIDPLAIADLSSIGGLLDDPKVEKIFHDADYDLRILDRDYGFRARRPFDTRIAAQLAGQPAVGPAALLRNDAGAKAWQRSRIGRRFGSSGTTRSSPWPARCRGPPRSSRAWASFPVRSPRVTAPLCWTPCAGRWHSTRRTCRGWSALPGHPATQASRRASSVSRRRATASPRSWGSSRACCAAARRSRPSHTPSPSQTTAPGSPESESSGAGRSRHLETRCSRGSAGGPSRHALWGPSARASSTDG